MSEQQKKESGVPENVRDEKAAQLDQVAADSYTDDAPVAQIRQGDLAVGDYAAVVNSSWLFTSDHDGALWIGFRLHIKGKVATFGQAVECDWFDQGTLVKAFKLEGNEYNVKMLLGLYRALDVRRKDGEAVCLGGDLCRTEGIPKGTWVSVWVKRGNDGSNYVAKLYPPRVTADDEAAAFAPQAEPLEQAEQGPDAQVDGNYDAPPAGVYSDKLPDEPPF